ncbi:EAL domain-containing protein [Psychromonas sp. SR45-3]|uniref:GGDEF/EAL domain-containing response regulator n=1 Tax=Psychromonas sp. SR45-3 TaxID=2760930 RepID=UPI001C71B6C0|nr:EAL domain-containing protein [Psychromonas sp. SR45-3]
MNNLSTDKLGKPSACVDNLHTQLKNAVIMMVDDEPILMEILQSFLEDEGYQNFINIEDSTLAMERLKLDQPDILLLDLKMPIVNGFDILKEVRAHDLLKRIPVIVLTSASDAATKLKALELGATDFLAKPVDASELGLRLRNTLTVKAYQDQLAFYDTLTGLPNRARFMDRLDWALMNAIRYKHSVAVMNLSVDRFKEINDTLGPKSGDLLLQQVADRLSGAVRFSDVISHTGRDDLWQNMARISGDEFTLLLPGGSVAEDAAYIAKRLLEVMKDVFFINGHDIFVTASIGIAVYPNDAETADTLMKNTSAATEYAKHKGRDNYQFYSKDINNKAKERLLIESELRRAIEKEEFVVHYQPKINTQTALVTGMEALVRWQHPVKGLLSPFYFIEIAEKSGLIPAIGEWVIHEACRQNKEWQDQGLGHFTISVNVSPQQFNAKHIEKTMEAAISSGMDMQYLIIEITEGMLMGDEERAIEVMKEIRKQGPLLSIDDFGTGYSSLSYLKRFPLNELKVDRAFIIDVPEKRDDCAIVRAIVAMAHSLELSVVAEGIENSEQLEFLKGIGCDVIQGFYFSKPLPADEFEQYVLTKNKSM